MNPPSLSPYDAGSIFCIVAQSTLVTLFVKAMKDLYDKMKPAGHNPVENNPV